MKNYTINYGTGITENVNNATLEEVKEAAIYGMAYTGCSVSIVCNDKEISISQWYGVEPTEEDTVLEQIGEYGFYADWIDL